MKKILILLTVFSILLFSEDSALNNAESLDLELDIEHPLINDNDSDKLIIPKTYTVETNENFRSVFGKSYLLKEGINISDNINENDELIFMNEYGLRTTIKTAKNKEIVLRAKASLVQKYDKITQRYTDSGTLEFRELYKTTEYDASILKYGLFIPKNRNLLFNNITSYLTQSNINRYSFLNYDDAQIPLAGFEYQTFLDNSSISYYGIILKPSTTGTQYTIYAEDFRDTDDKEGLDNRTNIIPSFGLTYKSSNSYFDYTIDAFYWFDINNEISYFKDADLDSNSSSLDDYTLSQIIDLANESSNMDNSDLLSRIDGNYKEEVSNVAFISANLTNNILNTNVKNGLTYFKDKNIYHVFQYENKDKEFKTYSADMLKYELTLQKQFSSLNILTNYSLQYLFNVPKDTNILLFENLYTKANEERDLKQHQYSLAILYEISSHFDYSILYSVTEPVNQKRLYSTLKYKKSDTASISLKGSYDSTEKQKSTNSELKSNQLYLEYSYKF